MSFSRLAICLRCRPTTHSPNVRYIPRLVHWDYPRTAASAHTKSRQYSGRSRRTDDESFRREDDYENPVRGNTLNEAPAQHEASQTEANQSESEVLTEHVEGFNTGYMSFEAPGKDSVTSANNQDKPLKFAEGGNASTQPPIDHYTLFEKFLKGEFENDGGEEEPKSHRIGETEETSNHPQMEELLYHDRQPERSQSTTVPSTGYKGAKRTPAKIGIDPDFSLWRPVMSISNHEKTEDPKLRQQERNQAHSKFRIHCRINEGVLKDLDTLITDRLTEYCELNPTRNKITLLKGLPAQHWRTYQAMVRMLCACKSGITLGVASPFVETRGTDKKPTYSLGLVLHDDSELVFYRDTIRRAMELDLNDYSLSTQDPSVTTGTVLCRGLRESEANTLLEAIKVAYPNGIDLGMSTRCSLQHELNSIGRNRPAITDSPEILMLGQDSHSLSLSLGPKSTQVEDLWTITMRELEDPTIPEDYGAYRFRRARHERLREYKESIKNRVKDREL
jgi:hypothetical protein